MENCTAWKSGTARKFSLNPVTIQAKATLKEEGRVKLTKNVSAVEALVTSEQIAEAKLTSMEDTRNLRPKEKVMGSCEDEETETSEHVPLGTIDLGSFEVLSDHGDTADDEVEVDDSTDETTEMMPPLPPDSWFKKTEMLCGKFPKPCNGDHRDEEYPFFDCWDRKPEQSDVVQHVDPWARNAPKSVPNVKGCLSVELSCLFCVSEAGGEPTCAS